MSESSVDQLAIKSLLLVHSLELEHSKKAVNFAALVCLFFLLIKEDYIFLFFFSPALSSIVLPFMNAIFPGYIIV